MQIEKCSKLYLSGVLNTDGSQTNNITGKNSLFKDYFISEGNKVGLKQILNVVVENDV